MWMDIYMLAVHDIVDYHVNKQEDGQGTSHTYGHF